MLTSSGSASSSAMECSEKLWRSAPSPSSCCSMRTCPAGRSSAAGLGACRRRRCGVDLLVHPLQRIRGEIHLISPDATGGFGSRSLSNTKRGSVPSVLLHSEILLAQTSTRKSGSTLQRTSRGHLALRAHAPQRRGRQSGRGGADANRHIRQEPEAARGQAAHPSGRLRSTGLAAFTRSTEKAWERDRPELAPSG